MRALGLLLLCVSCSNSDFVHVAPEPTPDECRAAFCPDAARTYVESTPCATWTDGQAIPESCVCDCASGAEFVCEVPWPPTAAELALERGEWASFCRGSR